MAKHFDFLPTRELKRLQEIFEHGTIEGESDIAGIVRYLAWCIAVTGKGGKQLCKVANDIRSQANEIRLDLDELSSAVDLLREGDSPGGDGDFPPVNFN